jgi:hypothetical protein
MPETDELTISGWVTPRLEDVLLRAAQLANDQGYNYLGVEHVTLAILEDAASLPMRQWDGAVTSTGWRDAIVASLPPLPKPCRTSR